MGKPNRQLVLNKGNEQFIFRYENGREDELLDALIEQAKKTNKQILIGLMRQY